ncbi:MAG: hypothetical protein E7228_04375 [Clostridiales bacterium]|nr:hypothetical protein [Clostridiales bacterium]
MECPYCKEEMEKGYIKSSHFIHWGKEKKLKLIHDDIKLVKNTAAGFFEGNFVESYYCSSCNKIIVSLD